VQAGKAGAESRTRCCHEQVFSLQDAQQPLRHLHSVVQGAARLHSRTFLCAAPDTLSGPGAASLQQAAPKQC